MHSFITLMATVLPQLPLGQPNQLAQDGITFFETWISRIGGIVAFVGAIKFAISVRSDDVKEQLTAIFTMISGFMIQAAVKNLDVFNIPSTYSSASAETEFQSILTFIGGWTGKCGALALFIGAILFGLSIKDNNATSKVNALRTIAVGGIVLSTSTLLPLFV